MHIAGHGELPEKVGPVPTTDGDPPQREGDPRGVVLSDDSFLGPREIGGMRVVPELVFINCCHLAARSAEQLLWKDDSRRGRPFDRARFAAGVAEKLIEIGVRCVIAAGWAVNDEAAKAFASAFYEALMRGERFLDAVSRAREAAREKGGNTGAAYQCYGDPDWTFRREGSDAQRPPRPLADEYESIASPAALRLALDGLAVASKFQKVDVEEQRMKLRYLEAHFESFWGGIGEVAEAFGTAWAEVGAGFMPVFRGMRWRVKPH